MTSRSRKAFYEDSQSYETTGRISFSLYDNDSFISTLSPAERDAFRADIHASTSQIPTLLNTMYAEQDTDLIQAKEAIEAVSSDGRFGIAMSFDNLSENIRYSRSDLEAHLTAVINQLQLVMAGRQAGIVTVPSTKLTQLEHAFAATSSGAPSTQQDQWQPMGASVSGPGSVQRSGR
ncbi:MAG TPA: hypothetical protein VFI84_02405 [Candidatus Saccharimonadales bacterium]|nr:hypothetical protein [Candidatus Saccharimonadales bacterium]